VPTKGEVLLTSGISSAFNCDRSLLCSLSFNPNVSKRITTIAMHPATARIVAALLCSALLHMLLLAMPELGKRERSAEAAPPALRISLGRPARQADKEKPASPAPHPAPAVQEQAAAPTPEQNGADLLPTPSPTYYTTDQLSKRPQPMAAVNLDPPEVRDLVATGTMVMLVWINEQGLVDQVELERSDLPGQFGAAAVAAMKDARFIPGELNGLPVRAKLRIEIDYEDGREPAPTSLSKDASREASTGLTK
jgi:TonB family protein